MTTEETLERIYLAVPYRERHAADAAGALWDAAANAWYAPSSATAAQLAALSRWRPSGATEHTRVATDPREDLTSALRGLGFQLHGEHPIMDGRHHRVPIEGDRHGERGGFYFAHLDGVPAGYAKNHRTGEELRWKAQGVVLDAAEQASLRAEAAQKLEQRRVDRERLYEHVARELTQQLAALPAATLPTAYQKLKGVGTHPGVYTDAHGGTFVPGYDAEGKLWTVQSIDGSGPKRFAPDSRKHGAMHPIGGFARLAQAEVIVIAEGYATAATVAELLGKPAVAAFDAGNLPPVAEALHAKYPGKPILVVGDDDRRQEQERGRNPGREKAEQAAKAVGGKVVLPIFAPAEQRDRPGDFTDFNDLAQRSVLGRDGARSQLSHVYEHVLQAHRTQAKKPAQRVRAQAR